MKLELHSDNGERVADLAGEIARDATKLLKDEVRLMKVSLTEMSERTLRGLSLYVWATVACILGTVFLSQAGVNGLVAAGLPAWASQLLIAAALLAGGAFAFKKI